MISSNKSIIWNSIALLAWVFVWFAPWPDWFETALWLKIGIALAIFITPGAYLCLLLSQGNVIRSRYLTSGFILSHLLLALLGTSGRLVHWPFSYAKNIFMILGVFLIATNFLVQNHPTNKDLSSRKSFFRCLSFWPMGIIAVLAMLMTIQRVITSDDLAYLAHVTNWQQMPSLNFSDVYFDTNKIESTRFWIVSAPFGQAFLTDISKVPGLLLLNGYYEPFLVVISIICFYDLARTLGISHPSSMASIAVQVAFMALLSDYLHPGAPFYHQLSTDKATAAFIFAPVFITNAIQVLGENKKGTFLNFLFSGISLVFMHPIISAYAVFIVSGIAILGIDRSNLKKRFIVIILALVTLTPQVGVRLIKHEAQPTVPTVVDDTAQTRGLESLITKFEGTPFYGFNPQILKMRFPYAERFPFSTQFLSWVWITIPLLALIAAIPGIKNDYLKQYILSVTSLVALAGIPFTGWLLGYFVSAWMLERTVWLYPFGISTIFLFINFLDKNGFGKYINTKGIRIYKELQISIHSLALFSIWVLSIVLLLAVMREQGLPNINSMQSSTRRYQELISIGQYIDKNTSSPVNIIGSDELNDFIPALSWKSKVISYRPEDTAYPYFYKEEEKNKRWLDRQAILSPEKSPDERMGLIQKYNIRYILIESYRLGKVKALISSYPANFKTFSLGRYLLIEIDGASPTIDL